jgi:hypothetical protein
MLWLDLSGRARVQLAPVVAALLIGVGADYVSRQWWTSFADGKVQTAVEDFYHKVNYWNPYVLLFPTACLLAWLARLAPRRLVVFALLALLFFQRIDPRERDPNYNEHSIVEGWAYQLELAKWGYWGSTGHRRWAQSAAELELADVLMREIEAGRITADTHVVHICPYVILFQDNVLFSLYTGINDDPYLDGYKFDRSIAGGRMRPVEQVHERLAQRPPYVVIHQDPVQLAPDVLRDYEEILSRDNVRLLRHRSLQPAEPAASG